VASLATTTAAARLRRNAPNTLESGDLSPSRGAGSASDEMLGRVHQ
jgi:hypothetical protein